MTHTPTVEALAAAFPILASCKAVTEHPSLSVSYFANALRRDGWTLAMVLPRQSPVEGVTPDRIAEAVRALPTGHAALVSAWKSGRLESFELMSCAGGFVVATGDLLPRPLVLSGGEA